MKTPLTIFEGAFIGAIICIIIAIVLLSMTGCATPAQQNFWNDVGDVAEGAAVVGAVVLDIGEPDINDRDAHRRWCADHDGHKRCR